MALPLLNLNLTPALTLINDSSTLQYPLGPLLTLIQKPNPNPNPYLGLTEPYVTSDVDRPPPD